jgi:hypothetical protein
MTEVDKEKLDAHQNDRGERNNNGDPFVTIVTNIVAEVRQVRLYESTWNHIVEQHPEFRSRMEALEHAVYDTIRNPTVVQRSTTSPDTGIVFSSSNNLKDGRVMVVPVKLVDGVSARVATAGFRKAVRGDVIWKRESDNE